MEFDSAGESGSDDVFGDPAGKVGRGAVHFSGVFAGEGTAAVATHAAVGVYDDFAAGEAGIALGSSDDELAGGVDEVLGLGGEEFGGKSFFDDVFDEEFFDGAAGGACGVLGGDDHTGDFNGAAVLVADGDLGFRVGPQPRGGAGFACSV